MPEVRGHRDLRQPFEIADRPVDDEPPALGRLVDVVEQVVTDDGAALLLAEEVDDQHVAWLQLIDGELVAEARDVGGLRVRVEHLFDVGSHRHELHGEGAPDELCAGVENAEAVLVLVPEALPRQHGEDVFGGEGPRSRDQRVGHLRPPVRQSFERVLRGVGHQLLARQREQLGLRQR